MGRNPPFNVPERSRLEWALDVVAVASVIGCIAMTATTYGSLPDTIPVHFGPSGKPDGWGHKNFVWLLPMLGIVLVPVIIYLCKRPDRFNYPYKITPENAQAEYIRARVVMRVLNAFIGCLFLILTFQITHPGANLLGPWFLAVVFILPLGLFLFSFTNIFRKKSS